jgi:phosphatidylglycerol:prolipoprotein diacylglycerol transferase
VLQYPQFNPIAIQFGPIAVRWYGLMYVLAFVMVLVLGRYRIRRRPGVMTAQLLDDLLFFGMLGTILGGRLGYVFFYQPHQYLGEPLAIFKVWEGGMSFHGGLIGVITAMYWFARSRSLSFWDVADFIAPLVPLGIAAVRLGNFINGELWGRPADVPWAMVFPNADDRVPTPRHPSQLYEMVLEGFLLFVLLWFYSAKPRARGAVSAVFLIGYGCARFLVEFTRQPDAFLGLLSLGLSMGQWLSMPMILLGIAFYIYAQRRAQSQGVAP